MESVKFAECECSAADEQWQRVLTYMTDEQDIVLYKCDTCGKEYTFKTEVTHLD